MAAAASPLSAQNAADGLVTRIAADSAVLTVAFGRHAAMGRPRHGGAEEWHPAAVTVETPFGSFRYESDSVTLAAWASAAAALPGPTPDDSGALAFSGSVLRPPAGPPGAMRLVRLSGDSAAEYHLTASNDAWEGAVRLPPTAARAFLRALRGEAANDSAARAPPDADPLRDVFDVDEPVAPKRGNRSPPYPPALHAARVEGEVLLRFVVGADGRPQPRSICVIKSSEPRFSIAARAALLDYRYEPAKVGKTSVAVLAQQPFTFALER